MHLAPAACGLCCCSSQCYACRFSRIWVMAHFKFTEDDDFIICGYLFWNSVQVSVEDVLVCWVGLEGCMYMLTIIMWWFFQRGRHREMMQSVWTGGRPVSVEVRVLDHEAHAWKSALCLWFAWLVQNVSSTMHLQAARPTSPTAAMLISSHCNSCAMRAERSSGLWLLVSSTVLLPLFSTFKADWRTSFLAYSFWLYGKMPFGIKPSGINERWALL